MNEENKHGTAVRIRSVWYISRDWHANWMMEFTDTRYGWFRDSWVLGTSTSLWVRELLTKKDRKILRKAYDEGVFDAVWMELDKIRSAQYDELIKQRAAVRRATADLLIEEVLRNA